MIAFTGSREVGLRIWESAGKTRPGQRELKRVVCEMGGKNAIIVDSDADLDEAIVDSIYSAFGYQGQKCSALSRSDRARRKLRSRDRAAARSRREFARRQSGRRRESPSARSSMRRAYKRILEMIEMRQEGSDSRLPGEGYPSRRLLHSADHFHRCETDNAHRRAKKFSDRS